MPNKRIIAIGGGEIRTRETLEIDRYLAEEAKKSAGDRRALALFIPTASHDCMPYYNTFHKIYTGLFGLKTDVALTVRGSFDREKMCQKFLNADLIYVGGGNTVYMIEQWKNCGLLPLIQGAYERGVLLAGLSAGAICWFEDMYTDSAIEGDYSMYRGLGWIKGKISPHYNERMLDFDEIVQYNKYCAWGVENNAALEIVNGEPVRSISAGGKIWLLNGSDGTKVLKSEFVKA